MKYFLKNTFFILIKQFIFYKNDNPSALASRDCWNE
jgi:hypothetical protein